MKFGESSSNDITDQLIRAYDAYCKSVVEDVSPSTIIEAIRHFAIICRTDFPSTLDEYWDTNDRMLTIWKRSVGCANPKYGRLFSTTGSTRGRSRRYPFGPFPETWVQAIRELTRFPLGRRTIVKLEPVPNPHADVVVSKDPGNFYEYVVQCRTLCQTVLTELLQALQNLLSRHSAITLISIPDTFLYLNRQVAFQDFVISFRDRINLVSEHWEPFYARECLTTQGVHIDDALGDWTTGLFYSTCHEGAQHSLPTSVFSQGNRINLLNLYWKPEADFGVGGDLFEPIGVTPCACGRNRLRFQFIPHQATSLRPPAGGTLYDPELAERLESSFITLQFIQEDETLRVYYQIEGDMRDRETLRDYFQAHGYKVAFHPNECYAVGNKRPVFYRYPD